MLLTWLLFVDHEFVRNVPFKVSKYFLLNYKVLYNDYFDLSMNQFL